MAEIAPVVITGASSGIGKAAALQLAAEGRPLVLVCREGGKARDAHAEIVRASGNRAVQLETADLSSQAQIRAVAQSIRARHPALSGLVNNAGLVASERRLSVDGIEMMLAVNHLAPFLLTNLLLDRLQAGAPARIITLASERQRPIRLDNLGREKRFSSLEVYEETKLANVLFTFELARRLSGTRVVANALAPGALRTALMRESRPALRLVRSVGGRFVLEHPDKGGARIARLVLSPDVAGMSGQFFVKRQPAKAAAAAYDTALAAQLWAISERLTGLAPAAELFDMAAQ